MLAANDVIDGCGHEPKWRLMRTGMGNIMTIWSCADCLDDICDNLQQNRGLSEVTEISIKSKGRLLEVAELEQLVGDRRWPTA